MQNITIPTQLCKPEFRFLRLNTKLKTPIPNVSWKGGMPYNDVELIDHIQKGGNYGIIGGHGNLCILDIDNHEVADILKNDLHTLTVKTCGGTNHFYFIVKEELYNQVLRDNIGEVRVKNYYVVGPNCFAVDEKKGHEGTYEIISDVPIREISKEEFEKIIEPYKRESRSEGVEILDFQDNDVSRSAYEFGEVIRLIKKGYTKEQVFQKMQAFAKWSTAHPQYRELTYSKALSKVPTVEQDINELKNIVWGLLHEKKTSEAIELMADKFLERRNIFTIKDDHSPEMWIYEEGIYVENGFCEINKWVHSFFGKHYKLNTATKIKEKIIAMTYIDQKDFFQNKYPHLLPVKNGLINLRTGDLEEFDRDKILFSKLDIEYKKDAEIKKIDEFIKDIVNFDEENKEYQTIQEFFGLCLYKEYFITKALMLLGPGSNGKTALLNLLTRLLGVQNISTLSIDEMNSRGFSTSELFGKMANICGELNAKTLSDTDMFKQLTGGETIGANRKFKSVIYFKNYAKLISACNTLPKTKDITDGFFRRWILLEFHNRFVDKEKYESMTKEEIIVGRVKIADPNILDKICTKEEMEGLLVWCLKGLQNLIINKRFTHYEDIDVLRCRWIEKSSSFMEFANKYLEYTGDKDEYVFKEDVDSQYCLYCNIKKIPAESINVQKKYLQDIFGAVEKTRTKKEDNFGSVQKRAYIAMRMKPLEESE